MSVAATGPRRWPRLVVPYGVVALVLTCCFAAYQIERPNETDRDYISPTSTADIGARTLATRLARRSIQITRVDRTSRGLVEASRVPEGATLFIPAPELVHPFYLRMIKLLPARTNVVLVAPTSRALILGRLPASVRTQRIAAGPVQPRCRYDLATRSGTAAIRQLRYEADPAPEQSCYGGSLVVTRRDRVTVTLVGAVDPFRNDRIGEYHNADLATELLATRKRLIWVDLHHAERRPRYVDDPRTASQAPAPPSLGPGSPDPDFPIPSAYAPPSNSRSSEAQSGEGPPPNPLWRAFPPWVYPTVALTLLALWLLALARARRMGGVVTEPLPITVRATETVEGRGRLYLRAKARGPTIATLRAGALLRLTRLLDLAQTSSQAEVVPVVAAAAGAEWSEERVTEVLYTEQPANDQALTGLASALEHLVHAVAHQMPHPDFADGGTHR